MASDFDIDLILEKLRERRKIFVSEADLQIEMGWLIKELHPEAKVRAEYVPRFDRNMHIDLAVFYRGDFYPIELKYKTKGCQKTIDGDLYDLKNHGAKDVNSYLCLKDIERIERCRDNIDNFKCGYALLITNELSYRNKPGRDNCIYGSFALADGCVKEGVLGWGENASAGTKKGCEKTLVLEGKYPLKWRDYSKIDDSNTGTFIYLLNEVRK